MRDRMTDGIPADAGFTFQNLPAVIAAVPARRAPPQPDARHHSLRRGLTASRARAAGWDRGGPGNRLSWPHDAATSASACIKAP
jgi:hypothetical protein